MLRLSLVVVSLSVTACASEQVRDRSPKPDGTYEEFDVTMRAPGTCLAATRAEMSCPNGGVCTRPAKAVACPPGLAVGGTVVLVMTNDLTCNVGGVKTPCPEHDKGPVQVPKE